MSAINGKLRDVNDPVVNLNVTTPLVPVAPLTGPTEQQLSTELTTARPTINLFDQSTYQTQAPVTLEDGSVIALPSLSAEEAAQAQSLFANVAPEHQEAVNVAASTFGRVLLTSSNNTITGGSSKLASGSSATPLTVSQVSPDVAGAANTAASVYKSSLTPTYGSNSGAKNYDDTVQAVTYMGILGLQNELGTFAQTIQSTQNSQNVLRADQSELQTATSAWGDDAMATQNFTWHEVDAEGNLVTKSGDLNKSQAQAALANVGSALSSYADMSQLQAIKLQNMTQNYQNGITSISNLMKAAYDTTKNTVGNLRG